MRADRIQSTPSCCPSDLRWRDQLDCGRLPTSNLKVKTLVGGCFVPKSEFCLGREYIMATLISPISRERYRFWINLLSEMRCNKGIEDL